jgi:hypothetical protein
VKEKYMVSTVSPVAASPTYVPYVSRQAAKVHQLRQQGENPTQIGVILGLPTATVDGYLGITAPNTTSVPNAALAPVPAQAQVPAQTRTGAPAPAISVFG